jgi:hypothetical protein
MDAYQQYLLAKSRYKGLVGADSNRSSWTLSGPITASVLKLEGKLYYIFGDSHFSWDGNCNYDPEQHGSLSYRKKMALCETSPDCRFVSTFVQDIAKRAEDGSTVHVYYEDGEVDSGLQRSYGEALAELPGSMIIPDTMRLFSATMSRNIGSTGPLVAIPADVRSRSETCQLLEKFHSMIAAFSTLSGKSNKGLKMQQRLGDDILIMAEVLLERFDGVDDVILFELLFWRIYCGEMRRGPVGKPASESIVKMVQRQISRIITEGFYGRFIVALANISASLDGSSVEVAVTSGRDAIEHLFLLFGALVMDVHLLGQMLSSEGRAKIAYVGESHAWQYRMALRDMGAVTIFGPVAESDVTPSSSDNRCTVIDISYEKMVQLAI